MEFVLDNSVSMRWLLQDRDLATMEYARNVLNLLSEGGRAIVPNLWALEAANVIGKALRKGSISEAESTEFITLLGALDIEPDGHTHDHGLGKTLELAQRYNLSSYDAAYLELALRLGLPLATVDADLGNAMQKAGGQRVLMN